MVEALIMKNQLKKSMLGLNSAFTLIEIMVVIGIIGILASIAIPYMLNPEHKLRKAARELMFDMHKTRSMAIKTNKEWAIFFDTKNNSYFISSYKGNDNAWSTIDSDGSQPIEKEVIFSGYTAGVQYGHGSATKTVTGGSAFPVKHTSYSSEVLTFDSKGVCSSALTGYGYRYAYLEYEDFTYAVGSGSTGIVRVFRWDGSDWQ